MCSSDCLLVLIALIFPPLPVWVKRGICSVDSIINIALCVLGFVPGLIHAWYIISVTPDEEPGYERVQQQDPERDGNVSYYYVTGPHATPPSPRPAPQGEPPQQLNYGTTGPSAGAEEGGSSAQAPPSYNDAVKGDNKVQTK